MSVQAALNDAAEENLKYAGFEQLPINVLSKVRKHIKHFDHQQLRKATHSWQLVHSEVYHLNDSQHPDNYKYSLNFERIYYAYPFPEHQILPAALLEKIRYVFISRNVSNADWLELLDALPNLRYIAAQQWFVETEFFGVTKSAHIESISMAFRAQVHNKRLTFKRLQFTGECDEQFYLKLLTVHGKHLDALSFFCRNSRELKTNEEWTKIISELRQIKHLQLDDSLFSAFFLKHLPQTIQLKSFKLLHFCTENSAPMERFMQHSSQITALYTPDLALRQLTGVAKQRLRKLCIQLEELRAATSPGLIQLLSELPNLVELTIAVPGILQRVVQTIIEQQSKLRYLRLLMRGTIGNTNVFEHISRLRRLESLDIEIIRFRDDILRRSLEHIFQLPELRRFRAHYNVMFLAKHMRYRPITAELRQQLALWKSQLEIYGNINRQLRRI